MLFCHSPAPLSSMAIEPYMISSRPSASTSATDSWWLPLPVHAGPLVEELESNVQRRVSAPLRKSQADDHAAGVVAARHDEARP